jgi:membrane protein DedA with SNARE-associated domain
VIDSIHQTLVAYPVAGLALVALLAWLEYVFPPVPGDSVMLLACFLAGTGSLPEGATIATCVVGSVAGALTAYALGARLGRSYFFLRSAWAGRELDRLERGHRRFGARLLLVNRFLPGIRGIFLYGAGIGRLPLREVMIYSTISNVAWVLLVAWAGTSLGSSWEDVQTVFRRYVWAIGIVLTIYVVATLVRARRRRRIEAGSGQAPNPS